MLGSRKSDSVTDSTDSTEDPIDSTDLTGLKEVFSQTLRQNREAKGWSQEKLALEAGLSSLFVKLLELSERQPTMITLFKLARVLDTTPGELTGPAWDEYLSRPFVEPWKI